MFRLFFAVALSFLFCPAIAQYKNDNVLFKTVYPQDLCKELEKNPGYVLLDVRSEGEFRDTSSSTSLNLGHFDGALNMDIRYLAQRWKQLASFKNDPVFVYCSHSQRSRRAAKLLADSGFTKVYNVNGGLTALYALSPIERACVDAMVKTANSYSLIAAPDLCRKLSAKFNSIYLLDVRPDSAWNSIALNQKWNAIGYLKGSKHIALENLKAQLDAVPKNKEVIVTDLFGNDAAMAAKMLKQNGFDKVSVLIEGMDRWTASDKVGWGCTKDLYESKAKVSIISPGEFSRFFPANKDIVLLDVRTTEEYNGNHKDAYRNIGHLKNAVNLPSSDLEPRVGELDKFKSAPVVIYAFSGGSEAFAAANALSQKGFLKVYVLAGGLFNLRWTAANAQGMSMMNEWVEAVPDENK